MFSSFSENHPTVRLRRKLDDMLKKVENANTLNESAFKELAEFVDSLDPSSYDDDSMRGTVRRMKQLMQDHRWERISNEKYQKPNPSKPVMKPEDIISCLESYMQQSFGSNDPSMLLNVDQISQIHKALTKYEYIAGRVYGARDEVFKLGIPLSSGDIPLSTYFIFPKDKKDSNAKPECLHVLMRIVEDFEKNVGSGSVNEIHQMLEFLQDGENRLNVKNNFSIAIVKDMRARLEQLKVDEYTLLMNVLPPAMGTVD